MGEIGEMEMSCCEENGGEDGVNQMVECSIDGYEGVEGGETLPHLCVGEDMHLTLHQMHACACCWRSTKELPTF